jgi:hypothetical protein
VVVDPVKPDPQKPDKPRIVVADPKPVVSEPKISCANGKVKDGACTCEPNFKPVKAGKNAWRCVADAKPETITCAKGTVKNGACSCARGEKVVKKGKHAWACVKVVVDPPRDKDKAKVEVKTAPKKTAAPKSGNADKAKSGKGKTAKKGNGSSAVR